METSKIDGAKDLGSELHLSTEGNSEINFLDLVIALAEHKRMIGTITAVFAFTALVISLLLPARYTAEVVLLPPQQNSSTAAALSSQLNNLSGMAALAGSSLGLKNPNELYVGMFRSRTVEDAMIQHYSLQQEYRAKTLSEARKLFERHSTVDGESKDGLLRISVVDHNPRRAAELANGYAEQFHLLSDHLAITEAAQRRSFFEKQLKKAKDNLADSEEALKATEQKTGLIQLDAQARALISSATALRAQIAAKEVQIQGMQTYATGQNAQLAEAQQELKALRAQLEKLGGTEESNDELMVPKGLVPEVGLQYVRKLRDVKYYEAIFDILARQYEVAKLDEAKEGAIFQVVDPAVIPDAKSFPRRTIIVIVSTLVGFLIGLIVVYVELGYMRLQTHPTYSRKLAVLRQVLNPKSRKV